MQEVIERCNLPMQQLFDMDKRLKEEIEELLEGEPFNISELEQLSRTFRQMMLIDKGNGLSAVCCNAMMMCMEDRDREEPLYLADVYPYLKETNWELSMSEVSYFKVHVQNTLDWSFALERVKKGYDEKEKQTYLDLFPFGEDVTKELDNGIDWTEEEHCYRVYFDDDKWEKFMKQILLDGNADLSKV